MITSIILNQIARVLSDNPLATFVINYYFKETRLPDIAMMKNINWDSSEVISYDWNHSPAPKFMRFHALMLHGVRKYWKWNGEEDYGIDFRAGENLLPASLIIFGENGSGKTSLFSAMEMVGIGTSEIAHMRGYEAGREFQFLCHGNCDETETRIRIATDKKKLIDGSVNQFLGNGCGHKACFCSDYDVERMEKTDNYTEYVLEQIGLDKIQALISELEVYKNHVADLYQKKTLEKEQYDIRIDSVLVFEEALKKCLREITDKAFPIIKEMMEDIVKSYFISEEGEQLIVDFNEDSITFEVEVPSRSGNNDTKIRISPRTYLNTFRFKLFIFSLKLTIGLCMKINNLIDFPYVIDDMFDSSDFNNRMGIGRFFKEVLEAHDRKVREQYDKLANQPDEESSKEELLTFYHALLSPQIIFLTQDDLIADSLYEGLGQVQSVVAARLIHPYEVEHSDMRSIVVEVGESGNKTNLAVRFMNLYDKTRENIK